MPIKFLDLAAQNREIMPQVERAFEEIHEKTSYVGGPQVAAFENEFAAFLGARHSYNATFHPRQSSELDAWGADRSRDGVFVRYYDANDFASREGGPAGHSKGPAGHSKSVGQCSCSSRSIDRRGFWRPLSPSHNGRIIKRRRLSFPGYEDLAWLISCSE